MKNNFKNMNSHTAGLFYSKQLLKFKWGDAAEGCFDSWKEQFETCPSVRFFEGENWLEP